MRGRRATWYPLDGPSTMPPVPKDGSESSDLPSSDSDDDVETAKAAPAVSKLDIKKSVAPPAEDVKQPLLSDGKGGKQPSSDIPMSPRDKFRQLGATTPRSKPVTPRGEKVPTTATVAAGKAEVVLDNTLQIPTDVDPEAAIKALAAADPAAAAALEMAEKIKEDPKAAALAAAEAIKNYKPPTAEELKASAEAAKKEAEEAKAAAIKLYQEMLEDRPPSCFPMADVSKKMERYVDLLISAIPEGKLPANVQEQLKPNIMKAIQIATASSGWVSFVLRWILRIWNMLPFNVVQMIFGVALCYFGGTFTTSIAAAEAFRTMGGEQAKADITSVIEQLRPAWEYASNHSNPLACRPCDYYC